MTFEGYNNFEQKAEDHVDSGNFETVADYHTLAGHEALGSGEYLIRPFDRDSLDSAYGLQSMLLATFWYRVAGRRERLRARQGISIAEELREYVVDHDPQRGLLWEYVGDLRLVADLEGVDDAYAHASEYYRECENPIDWQAEPEFEMVINVLFDVSELADHDIERSKKTSISVESLNKRISFKRNNYQDIVEKAVEKVTE